MHRDSCPQHQMQPSRRCRSRGRAIYTILPIVVTLMLLPTIAFATPPDPWWVAGLYDGADGDDVVSLVYETAGVEAAWTRPVPLLPCSSEMLLVSGPSAIHSHPACQSNRGPPTSPALIFCSVRSPYNSLPHSRPPASLSDPCSPRPTAQGG